MSKLLYTGEDWTVERIQEVWAVIDKIAKEKYDLDYYPPQIEIVTADQMIERCASDSMPLMYHHWSFGKQFIQLKKEYEEGRQGLAYEMILNTNPTLAFIMEENTMTMQTLVMAHAVCGHGSFFKMNYLFKQHTDPEYILNYLKYAREYIKKCEVKYGPGKVETLLDSCHALMWNGISKTPRQRISLNEEQLEDQAALRKEDDMRNYTTIQKTLPSRKNKQTAARKTFDWPFPEENLLYFIEKNSPSLANWEKEVVRITRQIAQYFYPQQQTKVMNEGWASFWHHTLMTDLWEEGYISTSNYMEFIKSHCGVCMQPDLEQHGQVFDFNPYALGIAIYQDIRRICEEPTDEDREYFPAIAGSEWLSTIKHITENYRDDSFIAQFLSPHLIRKFKMFTVYDDCDSPTFGIKHTQENDYEQIRRALSKRYNFNNKIPDIEIEDYNYAGDRGLHLRHTAYDGIELDELSARHTVKKLKRLWRKPIYVDSRVSGKNLRICKSEY